MILSQNEILKQLKKGKIVISPFEPEALKSCSYDLSLGDEFAFPLKKLVRLDENIQIKEYLKSKRLDEVKLRPSESVLGITREKIILPNNLAGFLSGRSRFARLGLQVYSSSNFVKPGVSNKQVFEIRNMSKNTIILKPGLRIAQIIFFEVKGKSEYNGIFKLQENIL